MKGKAHVANRTAHSFAGALAGGAAALYVSRREGNPAARGLQLCGGLVGGWCGGRLPDIFEPADSPHHRGFFHSFLLGGAAVAAMIKKGDDAALWGREQIWELEDTLTRTSGWERVLLRIIWVASHLALGYAVGLATGYASHLALDSATPRSLPILGA